jgi:CDP-diacylglycerol--glycerol-3-phosphate 3-phosphatidyltransferase
MSYFSAEFWPLRYAAQINKLKDIWLESAIKRYAADVRRRYPANLHWLERVFAPLIVRRYTGTVANLISVIRLLLAVIIFLLLIIHYSVPAGLAITLVAVSLLLFVGAGVLDLLDGPAARALHEISETGKILDPLADKILLAAPFLLLGYVCLPSFTYWAVISQESFLMLITGAKLAVQKLPLTMATQANLMGKVKNIVELVAGGFLFLCPFAAVFSDISNILFLISIPLAIGSITGYLTSVRLVRKT